jgi:hypothetical protein
MDELSVTLEQARHSYSWPKRYLMGVPPGTYELQLSAMNLSQELLDLYYGKTETSNERSKPVGLKEAHNYTDNDGDKLTIEENPDDDLAIAWVSDLSEDGFNVTVENSIPLALNVLGYDRPDAGAAVEAIVGRYGFGRNPNHISGKDSRDELLAQSIANLLAIDAYDQRAAERKAEEEAKAARVAEQMARARAKELARQKLTEVVDYVAMHGVNRLHADSLQIAVSDYKKAVDEVGAPSAL